MKQIHYAKEKKNGAIIWSYRFERPKVGGKRVDCRRKGFKSKQEAEKDASEQYSLYYGSKTGKKVIDSISFLAFVDSWLDSPDTANLNENTKLSYEKKLKNSVLPVWGTRLLSAISDKDVSEYLFFKYNDGTSINSLKNLKILLGKIFKYAVHKGYIEKNPVENVTINYKSAPKVATREQAHEYIPDDVIVKIFNRFPSDSSDYIPMRLAYECGLRIAEAFAVCYEDFDFDKNLLYINRQIQWYEPRNNQETGMWVFVNPKYDSFRVINVPSNLASFIKNKYEQSLDNRRFFGDNYKKYFVDEPLTYRYTKSTRARTIELALKEEGNVEVHLINTRSDGSYINSRTMQHTSRIIQNQIFDGFDFHSLRHTHATKLVENGLSIAAIQQRLGHTNLDMTLMYASHVSNQMNEKEIQALNQIYQ